MGLEKWGFNSLVQGESSDFGVRGLTLGRIVYESRQIYQVVTEEGRLKAKVSGHYIYNSLKRSDFPTIGDWVGVRIENDFAVIDQLVKRTSSFSRKRAGNDAEEQVIAANIDFIFLVFALEGGRNYSPGAIERFITRAWDSGASPVIILNKCDLCDTSCDYLLEVETLAPGVPVHLTSALSGLGIEELREYIIPGKTIGFTGFSGVGKSALINSICGVDLLKTGEIRESDLKGKHTTTHKELILLERGGVLIDSPGLKELQLWGDEESLNTSFKDISALAEKCRFKDCSHTGEPECAVQDALCAGELEPRRFENYLYMRKELKFLESKTSLQAGLEEKAKAKNLSKIIKRFYK